MVIPTWTVDRLGRSGANSRQAIRPRRLPGRVLRVAAFATVILAVACAGKEQGSEPGGYNAYEATRLFSVGYHDIEDIYIEDVPIAELAIAGLEKVAGMAPNVAMEQRGRDIAMRVRGHGAHVFRLPSGEDPDRWGSFTATALKTGRTYSPVLRDKSPEELYASVFEGMLVRLDRYSRYAGAAKAREHRANRDGFGGIGVRIEVREGGIDVVAVMDDSPAEAAGLAAGDRIVAIDGQPVARIDQSEAVDRLRGRIDSKVDLTIVREPAPQPLRIAIKRAHIVPRTVSYERKGDAAYIRISGFNQDTAHAVRQAIGRARADIGEALSGFVVDLRDNPGGLLDQAVDVSDIFVREGRIVSTHGRHPDSHQYFDAEPDDLGDGQPVVVLVNAGSASASEIVAAALQDSGRAVVIGSTSFGKGTVQTVLRLPNDGELTLTWARFHAPSGYALSRHGVRPDVCTSGEELGDATAVVATLRRSARPDRHGKHTVAYRDDGPAGPAAEDARASCPRRRAAPATDLQVALRLLDDPELYRIAAGEVPAKLAQVHH